MQDDGCCKLPQTILHPLSLQRRRETSLFLALFIHYDIHIHPCTKKFVTSASQFLKGCRWQWEASYGRFVPAQYDYEIGEDEQ